MEPQPEVMGLKPRRETKGSARYTRLSDGGEVTGKRATRKRRDEEAEKR